MNSPEGRAERALSQEEVDRLVGFLQRLGATADEIRTARESDTMTALALEAALRAGRPPVPFDEAATRAGLSEAEGAALWQALGFPNPLRHPTPVPAELADAQQLLSAARDLFGWDAAVGLARVLGSAASRVAEAVVDTFRIRIEVPERSAGASYPEVVEQSVALATGNIPTLVTAFGAVLKAHLVTAASGQWSPGEVAARRSLAVGFVDLVGYTALSRTLSTGALAALVRRFEELVAEVVGNGGARVVKLIGDGAMWTAEDPVAACAVAGELTDRIGQEQALPPVRVGLAAGTVVSLYGDYFGEVVNLAARLVALANPGTAVVTAEVAEAAGDRFSFERLPPQALKGFHVPPVTYRLRGPRRAAPV